ncbi:hypothetical protein DFH28DRAFT_1078012 [Melampsora americana]|nr:hypothetical protein DFH28DRAFT_1078012 [Melampsora americana]
MPPTRHTKVKPSKTAIPLTRGSRSVNRRSTRHAPRPDSPDDSPPKEAALFENDDSSLASNPGDGDIELEGSDIDDSESNDTDKSAPAEPRKRKRRAKISQFVLPPHETDLPHPNQPAIPTDLKGIPLPPSPPIRPTLENYKELAESWSNMEVSHYLMCTKAKANN